MVTPESSSQSPLPNNGLSLLGFVLLAQMCSSGHCTQPHADRGAPISVSLSTSRSNIVISRCNSKFSLMSRRHCHYDRQLASGPVE
ncbi:hypothetical protein P153DRAFT_15147 [Dothidotthia symphoricarpi CBS 119687]|uniref:Secreted protein n=1 Tax=Dothidotthia symphoricarpi CBS 119687 TaxID=1392245 RepID=A0A6A6AV22_9PLEO|nr:uncharacterized protein P153DRAFT_15147 [Dothidotthia symphoricarpi CBS 119687]KAF2135048.1 hypothetical protein P153DRAFT_15147 [Dothidotthia symphoricarpi CBS 119687]